MIKVDQSVFIARQHHYHRIIWTVENLKYFYHLFLCKPLVVLLALALDARPWPRISSGLGLGLVTLVLTLSECVGFNVPLDT